MYHVKVYSICTNLSRKDYPSNFLLDAHKDFIGKPVYNAYASTSEKEIGTIVDAWLGDNELCLALRVCAKLLPLHSISLCDVRFALCWQMVINAGTRQLERLSGLSCYLNSATDYGKDQRVVWTFASSLSLLNGETLVSPK